MMDNPHRAWERQPGETDKAWEAFSSYLDHPLPRPSLHYWCEDIASLPYQSIKMWARKNQWRVRLKAYDAFQRGMTASQVQAAIGDLRLQVLQEEVEDYTALRDVWLSVQDQLIDLLNRVTTAEELQDIVEALNKQAMARQRIDQIARRAAKLPTTYRVKEEKADDVPQSGTFVVNYKDGPRQLADGDEYNADYSPAPSFEPDDGEEFEGEI